VTSCAVRYVCQGCYDAVVTWLQRYEYLTSLVYVSVVLQVRNKHLCCRGNAGRTHNQIVAVVHAYEVESGYGTGRLSVERCLDE